MLKMMTGIAITSHNNLNFIVVPRIINNDNTLNFTKLATHFTFHKRNKVHTMRHLITIHTDIFSMIGTIKF